MLSRRGFLAGSAGLLAASAARPALALNLERERAVTITANPFLNFSPLEPSRRDFGKLTFLGGLELRCSDPEFGGISSGFIEPDGFGFLVASDHAHWIKGRFYEQEGRLAGVHEARIAPMIAPNGRRMKGTRYFDTEGMARRGNEVFISVERTQDILRFDLAQRLGARGKLVEVPAAMKELDFNRGVEAIGFLPKNAPVPGALLALAERAPWPNGKADIPGWILGPGGGELHIRRSENFDITDLNFLPGGDLLILERRFVPFVGLAFRIRRIPIDTVKAGALLEGENLIEASLSQQIDNMEVLMVHQDPQGRAILTLMSDDNFSLLQRTLVLRFALA